MRALTLHRHRPSSLSEQVALALTSVAGLLTGFLSERQLAGDPFLVGEFAASTIAALAVLGRLASIGRPLLLSLLLIAAGAGTFAALLLIAGDEPVVALTGGGKLGLFFLTACVLLTVRGAALYALAFLLSLSLGIAVGRYLDGVSLAALAKYSAPPLYVLLITSLSLFYRRDTTMLISSGILATIAAYGAAIGAYRGSLLGAIIVSAAMLASIPALKAGMLWRRRIGITWSGLLLATFIPVLIARLVPLDWLLQSIWATKSNVERIASLTFSLERIAQHPFTGHGVSGSFLEMRRLFGLRVGGFDATSSVHNQIIDAALFAGIPGAAVFVILYSLLLIFTLETARPAAESRSVVTWPIGLLGTLGAGAFVAILNLVVAAPFGSTSRVYELLVVAGVGMALSQFVPSSDRRRIIAASQMRSAPGAE